MVIAKILLKAKWKRKQCENKKKVIYTLVGMTNIEAGMMGYENGKPTSFRLVPRISLGANIQARMSMTLC